MLKIMVLTSLALLSVYAAPQEPAPPPSPPAPAAASSPNKQQVEVLKQDSLVGPDGYHFDFDSSDGTSRHEQGELVTIAGNKSISVNGSYSYTAPDGEKFLVTYTADDKGYKPEIHLVNAQN